MGALIMALLRFVPSIGVQAAMPMIEKLLTSPAVEWLFWRTAETLVKRTDHDWDDQVLAAIEAVAGRAPDAPKP